MATNFTKRIILNGLAGLLLSGMATSASAQVEHLSDGEVKQETKKGVRKAKKYEAPSYYKDTHLNTANYQYKKGKSGKKQKKPRDGRTKYHFDHAGRPFTREEKVEAPGFFSIFKRKK